MKGRRQKSALPSAVCLVILALCFLCGVAAGQLAIRRLPDSTGEELRQYLVDFASLQSPQRCTAATLALYLREPLLAFFMGFSALGLVLLPGMAAAFGFFLSFSVSCFTASFGSGGVLLALALMGLRCLVTLPCFLLLGSASMEQSAAMARGGTPERNWLRLGVCIALIVAVLCVDLTLSPELVSLALERIV